MIANIGSIRLAQLVFVLGCLSAQAQTLVSPDDGSGLLTMLFKQPLWPTPNIHYNAFDGNSWTSVPGIPMQKSTRGGSYAADQGWWEHVINTTQLEFVFNDNNGFWDNNDNQNYKVTGAGVWSVISKLTDAPTPPPPTYITGTGYNVTSVKETPSRITIQLAANPTTDEPVFGEDIKALTVDVFKGRESVRIKITDKNTKRWEVPKSLFTKGALSKDPSSGGQGQNQGGQQGGVSASAVDFTYTSSPFSFKVTRKADGYVLFDSSVIDLVVKDQYLQVATAIQGDLNVYGIGESTRSSVKVSAGEKHTLWARDQGSFDKNTNTYSSHPFFLGLNGDGKAHGVLLLNSNGMDVSMEDNRLIYQAIGGILDFNIVTGPTPAAVITQYTNLIGKPKMMPYWSYGFHQCRWGYANVAALRNVVDNYAKEELPLDVIWADIDYMDKFYDFTLDPVNYPQEELTKLIDDVHANNQKFVPIVDPGIPDDPADEAYTRGLELDVFIKDTEGKPYLGQVWPGPTVFPDFFNPNSTNYWSEQLVRMHKLMEYDGLWIDMNELANFCPGTTCTRTAGVQCPAVGSLDLLTTCCLQCLDDKNKWNYPPFAINNGNGRDKLFNKGISTSSLQYGGIRQYDAHNLYGLTESIVTNDIQEKILGKRSFVLSRSTFPGTGAYAAHWTGDNAAQWNDIQWSVVTIQKFGLFGIPMVGADICGFSGNSNMELCARWTALGAFYPFARNHNNLQSIPQETYVWPEVAAVGRKFIGMRYRLLPYLYTLGAQASLTGAPIARPLFFEFPGDANTHSGTAVERQFMLGDALLVTPVVFKGATSITGYVPAGTWFDLFDYSRLESTGQGADWDVKIDDMPVHIRGGSILAMHQPGALTSAAARETPFDILVALPSVDPSATGQLYLDDGEDITGLLKSTMVDFRATGNSFTSRVGVNRYADAKSKMVNKLVVLGVTAAPTTVLANDVAVTAFTYTSSKRALEIDLSGLTKSIVDTLTVTWN